MERPSNFVALIRWLRSQVPVPIAVADLALQVASYDRDSAFLIVKGIMIERLRGATGSDLLLCMSIMEEVCFDLDRAVQRVRDGSSDAIDQVLTDTRSSPIARFHRLTNLLGIGDSDLSWEPEDPTGTIAEPSLTLAVAGNLFRSIRTEGGLHYWLNAGAPGAHRPLGSWVQAWTRTLRRLGFEELAIGLEAFASNAGLQPKSLAQPIYGSLDDLQGDLLEQEPEILRCALLYFDQARRVQIEQ